MTDEQHGKRLLHRCWCGVETIRRTRLTPPNTEAQFRLCYCGTEIDWSNAELVDHARYVEDLIRRCKGE